MCKGIGRCAEGYGGWSQTGIALYNTLVNELTNNRKILDKDLLQQTNGIMKSQMEIVEETFFWWARIWDSKNVLHLKGNEKQKRNNRDGETFVNAVQIFGWKDGTC